MSKKTCKWTEDSCGQYWETECGQVFTLNAGTPSENGMNYCIFCGKKLVDKKEAENGN